jgi:phosphate transport system substrate-binding protein
VTITRGGIGYVENTFASQNHLTTVQLRNRSGTFVKPTTAAFSAAAATTDWNVPNFAVNLVDASGQAAWPIVSTTYILVPEDPKDAARSRAVLKFFDWAYRDGGQAAQMLDYIALPAKVQESVREAWRTQVRADGEPVFK